MQSQPQAGGAWPRCDRCGKPNLPDGLGTALKPATEIIILARKPFRGTVAANVLEHGTGALNVDGCRVGDEKITTYGPDGGGKYTRKLESGESLKTVRIGEHTGRWPANVVLSYPEDEYLLRPDASREQKAELYRWMSENA